MVQNRLFNTKGELRNYFERRKSELELEIGSTEPDYLLNVRFEDFSKYLTSKYSLDPPEIYEDDTYVYSEKEVEIDVSHDRTRLIHSRPLYVKGIAVTIAIPFDNDGSFFEYMPSTFTSSPPPGEIMGQEVKKLIIHLMN